ncbi:MULTISPECIES: 16S rRNA (cytosine(1402)-N(4))-methyltransferase RsmH [Pelosinus]|uniref:Ribosomal RNA small subunit methyltransferase H n=1 Tax=Pelosinus fermentans B4 TaxID=1149862 RepID=I8RF89_9FIRM|nr:MULTISPECIES: 16S rRNA (cytosine(1402)-N(4))-methyltransferase RsmH [Pelosinus]EIW18158.1 S-adenosyl-methyltransferase MraW [Pelosinus fermentans B4]EIW24195.1 Ribosomal RNA small subunit methyltransferase H [Pelosinus fermentans A11]OAM94110.1 Ribosomal RNA small subunit methyltransferase H [Pelosinus fermentans DSM 17108]SDR00159.1 16S rRNA (cytosine1402-N4)-methyltransferase [Pelosinus fermentans]
MEFHHVSVLLKESVSALVTNPEGIYVDCTLGGSGHAEHVVKQLGTSGRFIGIDQDPAAIETGKIKLSNSKCRVDIVQNNFQNIGLVLDELEVNKVDGVLFDLGVSSHQLDIAERGFSYMQDAPLDMRMNPNSDFSAYDIVNNYSENQLTDIIITYGEERWAKRIAKFIIEFRSGKAIETTGELVDIIKRAIPSAARRDGPHPAKRTFQAIRIEVNNELGILKDAFTTSIERLALGGRLCIITFHSLEDRIAKQTLQMMAKGCICPKALPICMCNNKPQIKILGKPIVPSVNELEENPRARSAKLRVAEKINL